MHTAAMPDFMIVVLIQGEASGGAQRAVQNVPIIRMKIPDEGLYYFYGKEGVPSSILGRGSDSLARTRAGQFG